MKITAKRLLPSVLASLVLAGCGASGSGGGTAGSGAVSMTIPFPPALIAARSASRQASTTAGGVPIGSQSVRVSLVSASTNILLAPSQVVTEPTSGPATVVFQGVTPGQAIVEASAHSDAAGASPALATAAATVDVVDGQTAQASLSFVLTAAQLVVTPASATLFPASSGLSPSVTLAASVLDAGGNVIPGFPLVWTSSNSTVAAVQASTGSASATVLAGQPGTATIQVREPNTGLTAQSAITVSSAAS